MAMFTAATAVNRFGLGARDGELARVGSDPRGWLHAQLRGADVGTDFAQLPGSAQYLNDYYELRQARRAARKAAAGQQMDDKPSKAASAPQRRALRQGVMREIMARQRLAVTTDHGFAERIVRFWSNHFAISVDKRIAAPFAAPMEREAIRPHAFGRFADMLLAVEQHPGMLLYLDNAKSIGVDSRFGENSARRIARKPEARKRGLNENLARETMELHTLGVNGGYTQADVIELAKAITGWSVPSPRDGMAGASGTGFAFRAQAHEPGPRRVLGKTYAQAGEAQGEAILRDLAVHPATARHLATKLATHFVADQPPPALVERMARAYLASGGELATLYRTMIDDDASWSVGARKFKNPDDFIVSSLRACGLSANADLMLAMQLAEKLGQPLFQPRSPAGFGDVAADWGGPDALYKRVQAAQALADRTSAMNTMPAQLGQSVLGTGLDAETATALRRAESTQQGIALLLASPDFQWRV